MCIMNMEGKRAVMDCLRCGLGLGSPECINSHLKALTGSGEEPTTLRYEEELLVQIEAKRTKILIDYIKLIRNIEYEIIDPKIYGLKEDDHYFNRKDTADKMYEALFMNPIMAKNTIADYDEPYPNRSMFVKGHEKFMNRMEKIENNIENNALYKLSKEKGNLQSAFLDLLGLAGFEYISSLQLPVPKNAKKIDEYNIKPWIKAEIYEIENKEEYLYRQTNEIIEKLTPQLKKILKEGILKTIKKNIQGDIRTLYEETVRTLRSNFLDSAMLDKNLKLEPDQAKEMGREAASWVIGLGAPIENLAMDQKVSDIYIDSQNAPIYVEHKKYGVCHTPWRYNDEMMEKLFTNIMIQSGENRKFDEHEPVVDVFVPRLNMRCHLQRPPATFNDLQAALRVMRTEPWTYPLYLKYKSMSPFFAGYDDLMVSMGSSEAVLGLKGSGKTSLVGAKIAAIGTSRRILPIQDIEEIPVKAYRKRGFHIGSIRVQSSEKEKSSSDELDLVTMANVSLRLGDACVIINEIRSRLAIQGVINLLNTQPGVFLLYNFHAESLQDVQDRLELVFGMPAAAMYSTDRYTVIYKAKFGRKGRKYRLIGKEYETDIESHKFVEVFSFKRGKDIDSSRYLCNFLTNPEASANTLEGLDMVEISKNINFVNVPPILKRRAEEVGLTPKQCVLQAFFKGKMYDDIYRDSLRLEDPVLLEVDFVLKCNSTANILLEEYEDELGNIDYSKLMPIWEKEYKNILKEERQARGIKTKQ